MTFMYSLIRRQGLEENTKLITVGPTFIPDSRENEVNQYCSIFENYCFFQYFSESISMYYFIMNEAIYYVQQQLGNLLPHTFAPFGQLSRFPVWSLSSIVPVAFSAVHVLLFRFFPDFILNSCQYYADFILILSYVYSDFIQMLSMF